MTTKGLHEGVLCGDELVCILIVMVVTQIYMYKKSIYKKVKFIV